MEVCVTNSSPELQLHFVRKFAKDLVVLFALHLAETISSLFRHVLDHPSKVLYDPETEPLFLPLFCGIRTLSFQNSYPYVIPLGYPKLALHRSALVELSIRSGLVTEHDLVPAGPDPIVEFAPEPDAETEPRASDDGLPLAEFPHSANSQMTETAPCAVATDHTVASS